MSNCMFGKNNTALIIIFMSYDVDDRPCNTLPSSHGREVLLLLLLGPIVGEVGHHDRRVQTHCRGGNETTIKSFLCLPSIVHQVIIMYCIVGDGVHL